MLINSRKLLNKRCFSVIKTVNQTPPSGSLTLIPTPIGNMHDLSPNILRALFQADIIGCEDRRVAGLLYTLIKNRNIVQEIVDKFGTFGISNLIEADEREIRKDPLLYQNAEHLYYNYANMDDKARRKFLRPMTLENQQKFRLEFLKYRALKILNKQNEFITKNSSDAFDDLYGIQTSDLKAIQTQILQTRIKKNRGVLIPLNTYSQTKLFDMVRVLLQSKKIAIISDAGMPCISDPGWKMVRKIRQKLPQVPIQIIGGPSSVGIMSLFASISGANGSLSGRFEGFSTLDVGNLDQKTIEMNKIKNDEFSINFINAKKLKKKALQLDRVYGTNHNILIANELTKKYERKFNGSIQQLLKTLDDDDQFKPLGQVSYLIYPNNIAKPQNTDKDESKTQQNANNTEIAEPEEQISQNLHIKYLTLPIQSFLSALDAAQAKLSKRQKSELLRAVFGIKISDAKKFVYHPGGKEYAKWSQQQQE